MNTTDERIVELFEEVVREQNISAKALNFPYLHHGHPFSLFQCRIIAKLLPEEGGVFLDIGTGMGIGPRFVKKLGARSISIDCQETGGIKALKSVMEAGVEGLNLDIINSAIPLKDGSVDCILFADVIEHLLHSPKTTLNKFMQLLKPGGHCIVTTPNAMRLPVRLKVLFGFSNWPHISDYFEHTFHGGHHHEYTAEEIRFVLEATGYEIREFHMVDDMLRRSKIGSGKNLHSRDRSGPGAIAIDSWVIRFAKLILLSITKVCPSLRDQMLLVARKPLIGDISARGAASEHF